MSLPTDLKETEERLHEAIRCLAALPDRERRFIYAKQASWPDVLRETINVMALALERVQQGKSAYEAMKEPRYVPSPDEIDRMDVALEWLTWIDKRQLLLLTCRAQRQSWMRISWRFGRSDTTVQKWHRDAVEQVYRRLARLQAA